MKDRKKTWVDDAACRDVITICEDEHCVHHKLKRGEEVPDEELATCVQHASAMARNKIFFATDNGSRPPAWSLFEQAIAYCDTCPVWRECLEHAAGAPESWKHGVYAGLIGSQRRYLEPSHRQKPDIESAIDLVEHLRREKKLDASTQELPIREEDAS